MNFRDPESMNLILGRVLRCGVLLSAATVLFGTFLLALSYGSADSGAFLTYLPDQIPHSAFDVGPGALLHGLAALSAFSWIELGAIILIATPVSRVLVSVFLFAAERDRLYVLVTAIVLVLLLFSMLVTPFIPLFQG
jgi:uncharacterized membrane protein